jgi:hypothetical protein
MRTAVQYLFLNCGDNCLYSYFAASKWRFITVLEWRFTAALELRFTTLG